MAKSRATSSAASVVDLTFAVWVLAIPLVLRHRLIHSDADLPRHIVTGRHILEHGPRFLDPFSFTRAGEPFLAYEWLSQLAYAIVHDAFGLPGVIVLATLLLAGTFALVAAHVRGVDPWLGFMAGIGAAVLTAPHWIARPHLFSFLLLAVLLRMVQRRTHPLWFVPMFALWANLHPGFLYGLVMIVLWGLGESVDRRGTHAAPRAALRRLVLVLVAAGAGSLLTPFGWTLHAHAVSLLGSFAASVVEEFRPLRVTAPSGLTFLTVAGVLILGLIAQKEWPGWRVLLLFGAAFYAALSTRRYSALFGVFALPVTMAALRPALSLLTARWFQDMRAEFQRSDRPGMRYGPMAAVLVLLLLVQQTWLGGLRLLPERFSGDVFPVAAVATAQRHSLHGRLLSEYAWGGFVLYTWPGQPLFIDSMADFYGDDLMREYIQLRQGQPGWRDTLERWDISLALFPPDAPIVEQLRADPEWQVIHDDTLAVLLARSTGSHQGGGGSRSR